MLDRLLLRELVPEAHLPIQPAVLDIAVHTFALGPQTVLRRVAKKTCAGWRDETYAMMSVMSFIESFGTKSVPQLYLESKTYFGFLVAFARFELMTLGL